MIGQGNNALAWELIGDSRRAAFETAARAYLVFYLAHMRLEETEILPAAEKVLSAADWAGAVATGWVLLDMFRFI